MTHPKITVVIPGYNHADYVEAAIASVLSQDWPELELHLLDDGSSDDTALVAERAVAGQNHVRCHIERQDNQGSAQTLNRLINRIDSDYVAILNSDDIYHSGRLRTFAECATGQELFFGFSGVQFLQSGMTEDFILFEDFYRSKINYCGHLPSCGFALLTANITFTSSNFFFSRELFDLIGGFNTSLTLTQDWDFTVESLRWVEPTLLPQRLLTYRVHPRNTWRRLQDVRRTQSEQVLQNYALWAQDPCLNPMAPTPVAWPGFFPYFVRICGTLFSTDPIGNTLPPALQAPPVVGSAELERDQAAIKNLISAARHAVDDDGDAESALANTVAHWELVRNGIDKESRRPSGSQPATNKTVL
jgi:hypothetical protein